MPSDGDDRVLPTLTLIGQLGVIMAACVLVGLFLGVFLDRRLHSSPVLTILSLLAGVAGGMTAIYKMIMRTIEQKPQSDDEERT